MPGITPPIIFQTQMHENNTENSINREEITKHVLTPDFMESAHETSLGI
ncbi:hypothetical protein Metli_0193 [Methanofollis liminatans DSM 4140]|uniref:Uncharacterized protein n=1 Tax=Methanofollis liminatans DSM 4140 TaxID=28892 RepID=J1AMV4_9EURY|nr:hypothetical protein Metli_0193 [Methanofollis liminatans DSM 4140]